MKEITKYNEAIDRLLASGFKFRIEDDKLFIHSYLHKGANDYTAFGFYYFGDADDYYYDLESNCVEVQDVISDAFTSYKDYVETYIKDKMQNMLEGLK